MARQPSSAPGQPPDPADRPRVALYDGRAVRPAGPDTLTRVPADARGQWGLARGLRRTAPRPTTEIADHALGRPASSCGAVAATGAPHAAATVLALPGLRPPHQVRRVVASGAGQAAFSRGSLPPAGADSREVPSTGWIPSPGRAQSWEPRISRRKASGLLPVCRWKNLLKSVALENPSWAAM